MTKKIVAFIDGSDYAQSICNFSALVSKKIHAPVELVHILGRRPAPEQQDLSGSIKFGARSALLQELSDLDEKRAKLISQHGREILDDAKAVTEKAGALGVTTRLRHGGLIEGLQEMEDEALLIIIGKRGEGADMAAGHLGSNLERLVRAANRPVLVASSAFKPIKRVLIAYDGGQSADKAVEQIATSPFFPGLVVRLVTVGEDNTLNNTALQSAADKLKRAGIEAETSIIDGQTDTALSQMIAEDAFDLLVMGAYGHSRIRSMIIGSTTTQMIQSVKIPVLLLR